MDRVVLESLNKIRDLESKEILTEATAAAPVAQAAGKGLGRYVIPGVGAALGAQDAYSRYKKGDYAGAAISGVGAAASLIPGVGGLVGGLGSAGLNAMRDKARTGSYFPDDEEQAAAVAKDKAAQAQPVPPGGDPKVFALQQQLIAKGAKITADGKMGPQTRAAMKQFPDVKMAENNEENKMSESQKIAELMSRLAQLEQAPAQEQVTDEGVFDTIAKNIQRFKTGVSNPRSTNLPSGQNAAQKAGAAIAQNPGKTAAAAGAAGVAATLGTQAAMKGQSGASATPARAPGAGTKPAGTGAKPAAGGQTANAAADPADVAELNKLASELENSQDPVDIELLRRYNGIINAINNRQAGDKRTQGEIAASADLKDAGM